MSNQLVERFAARGMASLIIASIFLVAGCGNVELATNPDEAAAVRKVRSSQYELVEKAELQRLKTELEELRRKAAKDPTAETDDWYIRSYDQGVITTEHGGVTYKAKCDISRSFHYEESGSDPNDVHSSPSCSLAIGLVGRRVQALGGKQKDSNGNVVVMFSAGDALALRSWRDEHTPWRYELFVITSVMKSH